MDKLSQDPLILDTREVLSFTLDGEFHIWPLIRFDLLTALSNGNSKAAPISNVSKKTKALNLIKGLIGIRFSRAKVQYITSTLFCIKKGQSYFNTVEDYYFSVYSDDSFLYENLDPQSYEWRYPRANAAVSSSFTYVDLIAKFFAILIAKFKTTNNKNEIEKFCQYLEQWKVPDWAVVDVRVKLKTYAQSLFIQKIFYRYFIKITKPKLLVINCASYGASNAVLVSVAKSLGVIVAEIQHGVIDEKHYAYNYSDEMVNLNAYADYLPDYLLTYGKYWRNKANTPSQIYDVGNPHIQNFKLENNDQADDTSILVISQWTITEEMIEFTLALRRLSSEYKITFRPHPIEKLSSEQINEFSRLDIIISDVKNDIYSEFVKNKYVIGCYSTSLYEAIAFRRDLFILKNDYSIKYGFGKIGMMVNSPEEVIKSIGTRSESLETPLDLYSDLFALNYKRFLKGIGI